MTEKRECEKPFPGGRIHTRFVISLSETTRDREEVSGNDMRNGTRNGNYFAIEFRSVFPIGPICGLTQFNAMNE